MLHYCVLNYDYLYMFLFTLNSSERYEVAFPFRMLCIKDDHNVEGYVKYCNFVRKHSLLAQ